MLFWGWCWPLTSLEKTKPQEFNCWNKQSTILPWGEHVKIAPTVQNSVIPLVTLAVSGLCSSPPPAGQLCSRCHVSPRCWSGRAKWGRTPQSQPCSWDAQLWLKAALDASLHLHPSWLFFFFLYTSSDCFSWRKLLCFLFFFLASLLFRTRIPHKRAEAHCLWRSATVRCPITNRAPRSHRHRALLRGEEIAHRTPEGREKAQRNLCRERSFTEVDFWHRHRRTEDISSSVHLYIVFLRTTLLTGTRHAALVITRWTGVGDLTW